MEFELIHIFAKLLSQNDWIMLHMATAWYQAPRPTQPEPSSVAGWNEYPAKAGRVNRHIT